MTAAEIREKYLPELEGLRFAARTVTAGQIPMELVLAIRQLEASYEIVLQLQAGLEALRSLELLASTPGASIPFLHFRKTDASPNDTGDCACDGESRCQQHQGTTPATSPEDPT